MVGGRSSKALVPPSSCEGTTRTPSARADFTILLRSVGFAKGMSEGTTRTWHAPWRFANWMPLVTAAFKPRDRRSQRTCAPSARPNLPSSLSRVTSTIRSMLLVLHSECNTSDSMARVRSLRSVLLRTPASRVFAFEEPRAGTIAKVDVDANFFLSQTRAGPSPIHIFEDMSGEVNLVFYGSHDNVRCYCPNSHRGYFVGHFAICVV